MGKKIKTFFSDYLIALVIFIFCLLLFPPLDKYKLESRTSKGKNYVLKSFVDVNRDGISEYFKIEQKKNFLWSASLFNDDDVLLDKTNLPYSLFVNRKSNLVIKDFDSNGFLDFFLLGVKQDSLYLIKLEYNNDRLEMLSVEELFLEEVKNINQQYHFKTKIDYADLNGDGFEEIVILANAGSAILPRRIYSVDLKTKTVQKSPIAGINICDFTVTDLNNDGKQEILLNTRSGCDIKEDIFDEKSRFGKNVSPLVFKHQDKLLKYTDCSPWLVVLDNKLDYLFEPIPFRRLRGTIALQKGKYLGEDKIYAIYSNLNTLSLEPILMVFDTKGVKKFKKNLFEEQYAWAPLIIPEQPSSIDDVMFLDNRAKYFRITKDGVLSQANSNYIIKNTKNFVVSQIDNQRLFLTIYDGKLGICTEDEKLNADFHIPADLRDNLWISKKATHQKRDLIMIDANGAEIELSLSIRPCYTFRYLFWILYYVLILVILKLIRFFLKRIKVNKVANIDLVVEERVALIQRQKNELEALSKKIRKQHEIEHQQKENLEKRQEELANLYDRLSSSANYGKNLKTRILPNEESMKTVFPQSFVFFKPRNMIGGDFYAVEHFENKKILIVGDCPGEAISAGFLSIFLISLLKNIRFTNDLTASDIIKKVNKELYRHLSGYIELRGEGVEMAVLIFEENQEDNNTKLQIASANIPIYSFLPSAFLSMEEIMPNDYAIRSDIGNQAFADVDLVFPKDTMFYVATKGLFTQEGNDQKEAFGKKKLFTSLQHIRVLEMKKQREILINNFTEWQGIHYQNDDVLCVGLKI